ncbi:ankyrin repeat domain-containing protein [Sabulicella rubraurantiaca]|uniref:ankyrin repeat domain-containing protein n=1 Tax=Sabulicella rubraurantiaca TaxID=2811429 RepID=UPI001A978796|nr:ankyrin repeat domain-containing protein [Sabulicella rubraurantiaca]
MARSREADLLAAAASGDVALLGKLLPAAGDPAAFDGPEGVTPLMVAASAGHQAVVELLLERGSNPSRRDAQGRSAADYARMAGHTHLAARLDRILDQEQTIW